MKTSKITSCLLLALLPLLNACNSKEEKVRQPDATTERHEQENQANNKKIEELNHDYPKVPDAAILDDGDGTPLYTELKKRYADDAAKLKQLIEPTGAKLIFMILTPDEDMSNPSIKKYGPPIITETCAKLGIECADFSGIVSRQDMHVISQIPRDGHWSKKGAEFIAGLMAPVIKKNLTASCNVKYKDAERPETFGDLAPSTDEILDGGKDLPYHVIANAQGVRMDHDLKFPKKKKHVLLLGDSGIFCPFLNNEYTIASVLQREIPEAEFINTGMICYTLEDYVTLWNEKAKYSEPDIVIVQTNGGDITDYFFTNRNHLSRSHKPFYPTPNEEKFYKKKYPM